VVVLKGEGELVAGGKKLRIEAGMVAFVPPGEPHQFLNKGAGPLEFLCIVPVHVEG
jgi:mannose-6-phosphate isomerase-like protein (cupin superfamily)